MAKTPLLFLDTETTALQPDIGTPWEIAWVIAVHDTDQNRLIGVDKFESFIELLPVELARANEGSLKVGRFAERYRVPDFDADGSYPMTSAYRATATLRQHCRWAEQTFGQFPHFVGAVPSFDQTMIYMNWMGWPGYGEGDWHYHLVDVENLAAGRMQIPPPWDSEKLCAEFGVTVNEADKHTAMGDVRWAMRLYAAVYELEIVGHGTA